MVVKKLAGARVLFTIAPPLLEAIGGATLLIARVGNFSEKRIVQTSPKRQGPHCKTEVLWKLYWQRIEKVLLISIQQHI